MRIDISEIVSSANRELRQEVPIGLDSFSSRIGEFPITAKAPIDMRIANRDNERLLIQGDVSLTVSIPCSRCLEEVSTDIRFSIDRELAIDGFGIVDEEMEEIDYLTGLNLDTDKLVYGELLVNWPAKVLCREDCRGICKTCGTNLNTGSCSCRQTEPDPRMAAIQDVFNKFKEV